MRKMYSVKHVSANGECLKDRFMEEGLKELF